jgi:hypothetical protein
MKQTDDEHRTTDRAALPGRPGHARTRRPGGEPVIWHEEWAYEVADQLRGAHAVLVWCNPIEGGHRRARLDAVLTEVAAGGSLVSAHPDAVLRLGTKDVLLATRDLPFGSAVHRIDSLAGLAAELPAQLQAGPRVLKQHRGQSGLSVWRVEHQADGLLRVRHAQHGSSEQPMSMAELQDVLAPYFSTEAGGHMIDQPWQARLAEGMVRAYLVQDRVAGFGHQAVNALHPGEAHQPGPRVYHGPELAAFQDLRGHLEGGWVEQQCAATGLMHDRLPLLWDCDFLLGEHEPGAPERYVLC